MKYQKIGLLVAVLFAAVFLSSSFPAIDRSSNFWGGLEAGPFTPGFRLVEVRDLSRAYPSPGGGNENVRTIRVYLWYPAQESTAPPLVLRDFVGMAADDFGLSRNGASPDGDSFPLPVPLAKGLDRGRLDSLLGSSTMSVRDARSALGTFPLLVLGQGLYYESPLSHFVMCEFLASHGYVVATCPLVGTQYRLVNRNVEDLETETRDMEAVLAHARTQPNVRPDKIGVIGYDLGGMAGLILAMRNPDVDAFLSTDSGILFPNRMGLPANHPSYREDRFVIPWMHITQARWIQLYRDEMKLPDLFGRKSFGASYLVHVPTENHGLFSSFAMLGIQGAVPGYWGASEADPAPLHEAVCRHALAFLDAYLKQDRRRLEAFAGATGESGTTGGLALKMEVREGRIPPPAKNSLIHLIIEKGMASARPVIERARAGFTAGDLFDEDDLNWLGYHFLYWWGREEEAIKVFELNTTLFPESANAHDSLGEGLAFLGRTEAAVAAYTRALQLDPGNKNATAALERLRKK
jgi:pimeloyl-ACP methyl ester carboxylesterase